MASLEVSPLYEDYSVFTACLMNVNVKSSLCKTVKIVYLFSHSCVSHAFIIKSHTTIYQFDILILLPCNVKDLAVTNPTHQ